MEYAFATENDLDLLAEWNYRLIRAEGHRNPMNVAELRQRMQAWLAGEYRAVIFRLDDQPVAYALYRESASEVYLRQFYVRPESRRLGLGKAGMQVLREEIWPKDKRLTVEVLTANTAGVAFWRAMGYQDYSLALEILPETEKRS